MDLTHLGPSGPSGVEYGTFGYATSLTRLSPGVGPCGVLYGEFLHVAAAPAMVLTTMTAGGPCGVGYGSFARTTYEPTGVVVEVKLGTPVVTVAPIPGYRRGVHVKTGEWWETDPIVNLQRWLSHRR